MSRSKFTSNRKYPTPPTVVDDVRNHTLALQAIIEGVNIGQRRAGNIRDSFVRLGELEDVGLIEIVGDGFNLVVSASAAASGGGTWGSITGTLSDQADLQSALDAKADDAHTHVASDVTDFTEAAQDAIGSMATAGTGIGLTYDDAGATLTANLDIPSLTAEATLDETADYLVVYDASAAAHRKALIQDLPFSSGGGGSVAAGDPFFEHVVCLLPFDGTDGATSATDYAGCDWTFVGNAQLDTAQSKFGGSSLLLDGTGDWITTPDSDRLSLQDNDFTIECWIRPAAGTTTSGAGTFTIANKRDGGTAQEFTFALSGVTGALYFSLWNANSVVVSLNSVTGSSVAIDEEVWTHVAVCRRGDTVRLFVNGVVVHSATAAAGGVNSAVLYIGTDGFATTRAFNGHIDDFRFTIGAGRYIDDFTVPASAYPTEPFTLVNGIGDLSDVDTTTTAPAVGDFFRFDGTNWVPERVTLNDLLDEDMYTNTPPQGSILVFDGVNWVPARGVLGPDIAYGTPSANDDEFDYGSAIDTAGARFSGAAAWDLLMSYGTITEEFERSCYSAYVLSGGGDINFLYGVPESGSSWTYEAKMVMLNTQSTATFLFNNYNTIGLAAYDSASTKWTRCGTIHASTMKTEKNRWTGGTFNSAVAGITPTSEDSIFHRWMYFRIKLDAGTLYWYLSLSGAPGSFIQIGTETIASWIGVTPTHVGFSFATGGATYPAGGSIDYFRKVA